MVFVKSFLIPRFKKIEMLRYYKMFIDSKQQAAYLIPICVLNHIYGFR
jgi:hypothetical protein